MHKNKGKIGESSINNTHKLSNLPNIGDISHIKASVWDGISRKKLKKGENQVEADERFEKEKEILMIGQVGCNENIHNPPVLETMARYDSDDSISAAFQHSSLSLKYTDIVDGKEVRKVLAIGYGYNKNIDIFPNLSIETTCKEGYEMVGMKIDISEDILKRILNYTFDYYNKYSNKYNVLTRNCNSFVRGVLREVRKERKKEYRRGGLDKKTDWSALEEAYKNHNCISPAMALKRSLRKIKKNSKNADKYFYSSGCVGFIGIKDDRVMLPTDDVSFRKDAQMTSQEDLGDEYFITNIYYRKNETKLRASVEETAGGIKDAQGSADKIIDNSVDANSDSLNEYGFNKKALDNTARLCQIVSNKCRGMIKISGRRHIHLDTFALKNATLFDDIAKQMKDQDGYVGYFSKVGIQKYNYDDFKISDNEKSYNGDSKKGGFLLNNHFPYGIFVGAEKNSKDIKRTRLNSVISLISKENVLKSKKLYDYLYKKCVDENVESINLSEKSNDKSEVGNKGTLSNESIASMMANDIRLYVNELIDSFLSDSVKDVLMLERFGNRTEYISVYDSKLDETGLEMKAIQDKVKEILDSGDSSVKTDNLKYCLKRNSNSELTSED